MTEPHPLRCETCNHHENDEELTACEIRQEWMPEEVWNWLQVVGCASHSSAAGEAEKVLEPSYKDLVEFARWTQTFWKRGQEIQREHNIIIDNLDDKMQKLAYTYYTDLCEIDDAVRHLFQESYGEKNELRQQGEW